MTPARLAATVVDLAARGRVAIEPVADDGPEWHVTILAVFGNVDLYVPEGLNVDVDGLTVFGHSRDWGRDAGQPDAPSVHVRILGLAGTIDVWRVPRDLRDSSYRQILRTLNNRRCPSG